MSRIANKFADLKSKEQSAFVSYIMAGDPNYDTTLEIMKGLPDAGVDIIEIGAPFTDPMADGTTIQLAGQRALAGGMTLKKTLKMVSSFRENNNDTPVVLMGYYNPIYSHGVEDFISDAKNAGVDGLIVVDLPPLQLTHSACPNFFQIRVVLFITLLLQVSQVLAQQMQLK